MYIVPWWLWHTPLLPLVLPYMQSSAIYLHGSVSKLQMTMVVLMRMVLWAFSSKNQGHAHEQKHGEYWPSLATRPNFSLPLIKFKRGLAGLGCFKGYHGIPFLVPKLFPPVGIGGIIFTPLYIGYWQTLVYSVSGGCCLVATTCTLYNTLSQCICECWHHNCV